MKRFTPFLLWVVLFASTPLFAQQNRTADPQERTVAQRLHRLTTGLQLTEDQQASLRTVLEKHTAEMTRLRADAASASREERQTLRQDVQAAAQALDTDILALLTAAQQKTYTEQFSRAAQEAQRPPRDETHQAVAQRLAALDEAVTLTEGQKEAIRPLLETHLRDVQALRNDQGNRREMRRLLQEKQQALDEAIEAHLDASQREAYRQLRAQNQRPPLGERRNG